MKLEVKVNVSDACSFSIVMMVRQNFIMFIYHESYFLFCLFLLFFDPSQNTGEETITCEGKTEVDFEKIDCLTMENTS
jgi:hypothetical protein